MKRLNTNPLTQHWQHTGLDQQTSAVSHYQCGKFSDTSEKGIDIKELPGLFNIKTTERYLHVRKEKLFNIVSLLDDLWRRANLEI